MKKTVAILLALLFVLTLCSCGSGKEEQPTEKADTGPSTSDTMEATIDPDEYILYQNIFFNDMGGDFVGKVITKEGVFTTIEDRYNEVTRYYVWGYKDNTRCCDWQWEIKFDEVPADLPPNGSYVKATGTFSQSEDALDGYWLASAKLKPETLYTGGIDGVDMRTMSCTLERVQLANMTQFKDYFEGKPCALYGRTAGGKTIQNPYYDGSWQLDIVTDSELPATGTMVEVVGTFTSGTVSGDASVTTRF